MKSPEIVIILINVAIILAAYFSIYPKFAKANAMKIAKYDMFLSGLSLLIAGFLYYASGTKFSALFFDLNWFWFTLLTYAVIEIPIMSWYVKKHDVKML